MRTSYVDAPFLSAPLTLCDVLELHNDDAQMSARHSLLLAQEFLEDFRGCAIWREEGIVARIVNNGLFSIRSLRLSLVCALGESQRLMAKRL